MDVPLLIYANKQDLNQALEPHQILEHLNMEEINSRKWTITACSAKTKEGLDDGLIWLVENPKK